ncbi:putative nucleotidyltransferase with HDIG domain [Oikeobacillus pervagus]|uniref:Nucleotidyltransferase with HDIG domain n=1 Tax=Oikeobacillus pervagus TaxID=1325931 RepID=A0AAJ1WI18_9BACI|nr:HD family phosphohydrolase [Oikeobacillus pervagus]MDQ0213918.1 putative nucleotidyltransferase with HDIG domain [Oikeobacillus pervagus]
MMKIQSYITQIRAIFSYRVFTISIFVLLAFVIFGILFSNVKPQTYDIELFSISDKTIRSPKTVQDEIKTEEERQKAADEVEPVFVYKKDIVQNRVSLITSIFDFVEEVHKETEDFNEDEKAKLASLKKKLTENVTEDVTKSMSDQTLTALLQADTKELAHVKKIVIEQVGFFLQNRIRDDSIDTFKNQIEETIENYSFNPTLKVAAVDIARYAIVPTEIYNEQLTDERKELAMDNVEPIRILQGQVVVQEGHLIDRETYRQLELLGLLESNTTFKPLIGLGLFVIVLISLLYYYFHTLSVSEEKKQTYLILISSIFILSLILMKIVEIIEQPDAILLSYIFPAAMAPMLISIMLNERIAMVMTILLASCGSIVFHDGITGSVNMEMALYILLSGLSSVLFLANQQRSSILKAGLYVSIINVFVILFLKLLGSGQYTNVEYIYYTSFAFISGISSSVFTIGLLPFFEAGFGILSTMKLIELSNPNHPLLKKLLVETPGTYHHSVMVANLAESACEAIGANGLLARVGCYYHDIGKTKRPQFFIENQMNIDNPHDCLLPEISKRIIIDHVSDGVKMLQKYKLPKEIIEIARQHHGTTLVKYFYLKAKEKDEEVVEEDFRYSGPKPQTREIAVISIADSVEAAVRSMKKPTPEQIRNLVHRIVQDRLQDGQFNECDISLKELEIIKETLCESLNGIFHSRIEYPELKDGSITMK